MGKSGGKRGKGGERWRKGKKKGIFFFVAGDWSESALGAVGWACSEPQCPLSGGKRSCGGEGGLIPLSLGSGRGEGRRMGRAPRFLFSARSAPGAAGRGEGGGARRKEKGHEKPRTPSFPVQPHPVHLVQPRNEPLASLGLGARWGLRVGTRGCWGDTGDTGDKLPTAFPPLRQLHPKTQHPPAQVANTPPRE